MECSRIARIPLFASLDRTQMECVAEALCHMCLQGDTVLFEEGEKGDRLYIVLEGLLDVIKARGTPEERVLATLGPGSHVGEISLLDPEGIRTATVRSSTAVELAALARTDFDLLLDRHPRVACQLATGLSMHLRNTDNATIRDLQEKNAQLLEAYQDLKSAHAQIVEKEKLEHELKVAREIQESILPRTLPSLAGLDFGACMHPARAVGGDFFDFIPLGERRRGHSHRRCVGQRGPGGHLHGAHTQPDACGSGPVVVARAGTAERQQAPAGHEQRRHVRNRALRRSGPKKGHSGIRPCGA